MWVEDFWGYGAAGGEAPLYVEVVPIKEPRLGRCSGDTDGQDQDSDCTVAARIAYRAAIPQQYLLSPDAPITMRMYLWKLDGFSDGKPHLNPDPGLIFTVIAKRLQDGETVEDWGPMRWIEVDHPVGDAELVVLDLPLGPAGLDYPAVGVGDFLAFELDTHRSDEFYILLGVEFFAWDTAVLDGAIVHTSEPPDPP